MMEPDDRHLPQPREDRTYPESVREFAYQRYFACGMSATRTSKSLLDDGVSIPERTIRHWARVYGWRARQAAERLEAMPQEYFGIMDSTLAQAAMDGAAYIAAVNSGEAQPDKLRILAAVSAIDRAGYAPPKVNQAFELRSTRTDSVHDELTYDKLRTLTPEQIRAIEAGRPAITATAQPEPTKVGESNDEPTS